MAPRLSVALAAAGVAALAALAACGETARDAAPARPAQYVATVEELLNPPAQLIAALSAGIREPGRGTLGRARVRELLGAARERLAALRQLRLEDAGLRRHRDRLAAAYAGLILAMEEAGAALAGGDPHAMRAAAPALSDSIRSLPSAAAGSSSSR